MYRQKLRDRITDSDWTLALLAIILIVGLVAGVYWLVSWLLMWGWNVAIATTFGLPVINQWIAFAMIIVFNIIGSSFKTTITKKAE